MSAKKGKGNRPKAAAAKREADYRHPEAESPLRPDVGTQAQFKKRKPPVAYRYDSSLAPALNWDGQNSAREQGEAAIKEILDLDTSPVDNAASADEAKKAARAALSKAKAAAERLKRLGKPFLDWTGKAERLSFDVPTLPLFVHERLSTKAIIETLKSHEKQAAQADMFDLFGDPKRSVADQVLKAYEYKDKWVNRLILGDSLVVTNSLLHYEGLGGQVQMIYIDPPYGVKFGSNFQPFVRKRDVSHNDDDDMTREPEMVKAYRDTWELGLHSYLTYLRDRLLLARDLLHPSGSVFVQISDENLHHVREIGDEIFGSQNFVVTFLVKKTGAQKGNLVESVNDYLVWYVKDRGRAEGVFSKIYERSPLDEQVREGFRFAELPSGEEVGLKELGERREVDYLANPYRLFVDYPGAKIFADNPLTSGGYRKNQSVVYKYRGREFDPGISQGSCWKHTAISDDGSPSGLDRLASSNRLFIGRNQLRVKRYVDDFAFKQTTNW